MGNGDIQGSFSMNSPPSNSSRLASAADYRLGARARQSRDSCQPVSSRPDSVTETIRRTDLFRALFSIGSDTFCLFCTPANQVQATGQIRFSGVSTNSNSFCVLRQMSLRIAAPLAGAPGVQ